MISEAKKRADARYHAKKIADGTNKRIGATVKTEDYNMIENYSQQLGISKAQLIVKAVRYCKEHDIKLQ